MPLKDGFEATEEIRKIEASRCVPNEEQTRIKIYALTGMSTREDKERAVSIGFDG